MTYKCRHPLLIMSCSISAQLSYGGWKLALDASIDLAPVTLLVGPNLTGKSLVMCLLASALGKPHKTCPTVEARVRCSIEGGYVLFLDAYRASAYIYEIVEGELSALEELSDFLSKNAATEHLGEKARETLNHIRAVMERDLSELLDAKKKVDDTLLRDAEIVIDREREKFQKFVEEMKLQADVDYFLPLMLIPTDDGYIWYDRAGPKGSHLKQLSTGFAAAMVVTALKYAYAIASDKPAYLFVEEPEAHAGPLQAFFLGHLAAVLTKRAEERGAKLFFVASTHSLEFVRGATSGWTNICVTERSVDKENKTITLLVKKWERRDLVPHFFESAALAIRRGIL